MDGLNELPDENIAAVVAGSFPSEYEQSLSVLAARANAMISPSIRSDLFTHLESTRTLFENAQNGIADKLEYAYTKADLMAAIELSRDSSIEVFEYFALNTFLEMENVLHTLSIPPECFVDHDPLNPDVIHRAECQLSIVAATESVTFAENLQRISQKARASANTRHEPVKALKLAFIQTRQSSDNNLSAIEHARQFFTRLTPDERCGLSSSNGPATLSRAYGQFVKNGSTR